MKQGAFLIFAVFTILFGKIYCDEFEQEEPNVYIVTDDNFDGLLKQFNFLFVKFYAPWCGHCKSLAPEFNKAALVLQEKGVAFGSMDATVQQQLAAKFKIQGYPTVKMFIDGVPIDYESGRQSEDIVAWVEAKLAQKTEEVKTVEELDKMISEKKVVVAYFGEDNNEFKLFAKIVKQFDDIYFAHSFAADVKEHFKAQTITLFKKFDEKRNDYLEEFDVAKIYEFIVLNSIPTILDFDNKAAQLIFGEQRVALVIFLNTEKHEKEFSVFEEASKELKDKLVLTKSVIDSGLGQRFAEYVGVNEDMLPIIYIMKVVGNDIKKYKFEGEFTSANLLAFYNEYTEGKLIVTKKSEEIPETNNEPVIKVVGKQFHQIVMDPTKDVLVKYYAPWCGHCKQLAPIYVKIAEQLKSNPKIIIAEYDATVNENDEVSIQGFPTLIFYPAEHKNEPVIYEGGRTEKEIISFLKEHATFKQIDDIFEYTLKALEMEEEQKSEL